jgi:dihydroorotate dehydrogenase
MGWRVAAYRALRPLLFAFDSEAIHAATVSTLSVVATGSLGRALCAFASGVSETEASRTPVEVMGLRFRNRIGLAAGFDKDGVAIRGWAALGFGFVELGTVTPRAQQGNPRPRLVRLVDDAALVNRMGFNNAGADALAGRIADARPDLPDGFVIGVNIGRNRDTPDARAVDDYVNAARTVSDVADYLAINVSSPNTPGLRDLQSPDVLRGLLADVAEAAPRLPLLVKLSPDLGAEARADLMSSLARSPASGAILSNTTVARPGLRSSRASEAGGLSGRPLMAATAEAVAAAAGSGLTLVASGGVSTGDDVRRLRHVGADLVQLWTGMIYAGPGLIGEAIEISTIDA